MENLLFLGVPILKHIMVVSVNSKDTAQPVTCTESLPYAYTYELNSEVSTGNSYRT